MSRSLLFQNLDDSFNDSELETLCFHIGIDYDNLKGSTKQAKVRDLIVHCERTNRTSELVVSGQNQRPHLTWPNINEVSQSLPAPSHFTQSYAVGNEDAAIKQMGSIHQALGPIDETQQQITPHQSQAPSDHHYRIIMTALAEGRVVPFLGGDVNMCGRPSHISWEDGAYWPTTRELAEYLAKQFHYPLQGGPLTLAEVSQYVSVTSQEGSLTLYEELRTLFESHGRFKDDYPLPHLHKFFAALPGALRAKGYWPRYRLIVTTNYDDALERAFQRMHEPFDLVSYVAEGHNNGKFVHRPPNGSPRLIESSNQYHLLSPEQRTVILKIRGLVDQVTSDLDSYVITEDHVIDFLSRANSSNSVPTILLDVLKNNHVLFLGYGLRDWYRRAVLHRIWPEHRLSRDNWKWWILQSHPELVDQQFGRIWRSDILDVSLEAYIATLSGRVANLAPRGGRRD